MNWNERYSAKESERLHDLYVNLCRQGLKNTPQAKKLYTEHKKAQENERSSQTSATKPVETVPQNQLFDIPKSFIKKRITFEEAATKYPDFTGDREQPWPPGTNGPEIIG